MFFLGLPFCITVKTLLIKSDNRHYLFIFFFFFGLPLGNTFNTLPTFLPIFSINSFPPCGLPWIVLFLIASNSSSLPFESRYSSHSDWSSSMNSLNSPNLISLSSLPVWYLALDHFYSHAFFTKPALTGFLSTYLITDIKWISSNKRE